MGCHVLCSMSQTRKLVGRAILLGIPLVLVAIIACSMSARKSASNRDQQQYQGVSVFCLFTIEDGNHQKAVDALNEVTRNCDAVCGIEGNLDFLEVRLLYGNKSDVINEVQKRRKSFDGIGTLKIYDD